MLRMIALVTLLVHSVCAFQYEMYRIPLDKDLIEIEESSGEMMAKTNQELPGKCWACKWIMKKLKKRISAGATQDDIKKKLSNVCDEIGFLKSICKGLVNQYVGTLVEELSTTDNPATICMNVGICKKSF
ncbi:antimicrobial peptide NK-lysin-like [Triplophysa rosa]|uniref:Saposin B-type domain-containing protein n=1 Tax=Triplophysa rosa TaxID=992332 RepID=A0A9W7WMK8_TRIRA|nr:antimicrobial peptide NK-lysin-like [Triplophysa rosa]KAI7804960.1 hypothetical protein IRJ41_024336 [Triplophysa rosa]